jgi:hypothetical protein
MAFTGTGVGNKIPEKGCDADFVGTYVAPPTTQAIPDPLLQLGPYAAR